LREPTNTWGPWPDWPPLDPTLAGRYIYTYEQIPFSLCDSRNKNAWVLYSAKHEVRINNLIIITFYAKNGSKQS